MFFHTNMAARGHPKSMILAYHTAANFSLGKGKQGKMSGRTNKYGFPTEVVSGVYEILNTETGKRYIGSSNNIYLRWRSHSHGLNANRHINKYLQYAWNKYGVDKFMFSVLELCKNDKDVLWEREQYWLDYYNTGDDRYGYNYSDVVKSAIRGTTTEDIENGSSKYSKIQIDTFCFFASNTDVPYMVLCPIIGITNGEARSILNGHSLQRVVGKLSSMPRRIGNVLDAISVIDIVQLIKDGYSSKVIGEAYGVEGTLINCIKNGKSWTDITGGAIQRSGNLVYNRSNIIAVTRMSLDGNMIAEYRSISEAHRKTGVSRSSIRSVCNGDWKSSNGEIWAYSENTNHFTLLKPLDESTIPPNTPFKIHQILPTGDLVKIWDSTSDIADELGTSQLVVDTVVNTKSKMLEWYWRKVYDFKTEQENVA